MGVAEVFGQARDAGFSRFELFTQWTKSRVDFRSDANPLLAKARAANLTFCALHLPQLKADDYQKSLHAALEAARFAGAVGASIVLFKADDLELFVRAAPALLDECQRAGVRAVLPNHAGSALEFPHQTRAVLDEVSDARLGVLLEVGHFHSVGVSWREAVAALGERVWHVHIKDQIGAQSVPFGEGEVDLAGVFGWLRECDYSGDVVLEMELEDPTQTTEAMRRAREICARFLT